MFGIGKSKTSAWTNGVQPAAYLRDEPMMHRSNFKSALEHISVPDDFFRGINVFKVTYKGKLEPATMTISHDKFIISVMPRTVKLERAGSSGGSSLKRPNILSRGRSGTSVGSSVTRDTSAGGSIGTNNSVEGMDAMSFSSNPHTVVDIGSIDRIQSGQNTLLFEKARWVFIFQSIYYTSF